MNDSISVAQDKDVSMADSGTDVVVVADFEVEVIAVEEQGPPGPQGVQGVPGKDGNTILFGTADPQPYHGVDGNFYINTTTDTMFGPKTLGVWPPGESIVGPQGPQGIQGVQGVRGSQWYEGAGPPGAISGALAEDNYLNTTNGDVYSYSGSSWGSPVGNIRGPQGIQGPAGSVGVAITYISDTPPVGAADNSLWLESDTGVLYARWNDGTSTQWVAVTSHQDATSLGVVSYAVAQPLTAPQQQQARQNVYAAPFDALAYNGLQVNGSCDISQINGGNWVTTLNGIYILDCWIINTTSGSFQAAQNTLPAPTPFGSGIQNGLVLQSLAAWTIGANDFATMRNTIEGYRCARLGWGTAGAQPITICFWVWSSNATGLCSLHVTNGASTRNYIATFNVNAVNTWEYKTITIPGDVAGTWDKANTTGMFVYLCFGAGANQISAAPVGNWSTTIVAAAPGQVNFFSSSGVSSVYVTGFSIFPGNEGPSAARSPFIMRPYDEELRLCQRYLCRFNANVWCAWGMVRSANTSSYLVANTPVPLRAAPTISYGNIGLYSGDTNVVPSSFGTATLSLGTSVVTFSANHPGLGGGAGPCMLITGGGGWFQFSSLI